ncbi:hypothetical protein ACA910_013218 [Epithemia clementina (nom. ined.)]
MTNSNTVHSLVSLTPCLFGLPPSNTTTTINSPCTPPTISNVVEKVVGSFRSSFVEEREDLYLVLPPPAGCFVGIKWRSTVPAVQDVASREMRLDALLSQNVEIKVCPSSSSSSLHGTHISSDPGDVQGWAKFNVLLRERANHQHVQWQQECSPNVSPEIRFALTVQSCLEEIAKQCQDPELSNSLHSAAKAVFSEQSETNSKEATNSRTTNNAMRWPSFRFMTVSKSRVQAPVLGGYGAWMEETDLVVRDATFHFVSIGDDTNNFCSGQSSKQNEERKARSWMCRRQLPTKMC